MNNNSPKSATVAGLLGIFLGSLGIHNFYLGDKKKGIIHLCLLGGVIVLSIISTIVAAASVASLSSYTTLGGAVAGAGVVTVLGALSGIISAGNAIWGLVEGIIILVQGDAGLAAKGIPVATAAAAPQATAAPAAEPTAAPAAEEKAEEKKEEEKKD